MLFIEDVNVSLFILHIRLQVFDVSFSFFLRPKVLTVTEHNKKRKKRTNKKLSAPYYKQKSDVYSNLFNHNRKVRGHCNEYEKLRMKVESVF